MKEAGYAHWSPPNTGATNSSGLTGLPGGYRFSNGTFENLSYAAILWTSTEYSTSSSWRRSLHHYYEGVSRVWDSNKTYGQSIRCIKN